MKELRGQAGKNFQYYTWTQYSLSTPKCQVLKVWHWLLFATVLAQQVCSLAVPIFDC